MPDREYYQRRFVETLKAADRVIYRSGGFALREATSLPRRWRDLGDWLDTHQLFGHRAGEYLTDFALGTALGIIIRSGSVYAITHLTGADPLQIAMTAGALSGAARASYLEFRRQQRSTGSSMIESRGRIGWAFGRGFIMGGAGGFVGAEVTEHLLQPLTHSLFHHPTPSVGAPEGASAVPSQTPEATQAPSPTRTPEPTPTRVPQTATPTETPRPAAVVPGREVVPNTVPVKPSVPLPEGPVPADHFVLEQDSTIWGQEERVLSHAFGRPPTIDEVKQASNLVLSENHILNDRTIPAGSVLSQNSVINFINQTLSEHLSIEDKLAHLPDVVSLHPGSFPWIETQDYLRIVLGREPTSDEILTVVREVCRQSNIDAPSIGVRVPGGISEKALSPNTALFIKKAVQNTLLSRVAVP